MLETGMRNPENAAAAAGLSGSGKVFWNLAAPTLYERAVARGEGRLSAAGALVVETGPEPGEAPRHLVWDETGPIPAPDGAPTLPPAAFERLRLDMLEHAAGRTLFAQDLTVAIGPGIVHRLRFFTEHAWHALALRNLLWQPDRAAVEAFVPDVTLFCLPHFKAEAERHGLAGLAVAEDPALRLILVGGTLDPGAMERAILAHLDEVLAGAGALALGGAASQGTEGDVALFLGPAGSGTSTLAGTLAADPRRARRADGLLGWSREGVFALFGGRRQPMAAEADGFGAVLENVPLDGDSRIVDAAGIPARARATFAGRSLAGLAAAPPRALVLTSCDGFGVLPPIARLTPSQAVYHLLSGYTAPCKEGDSPRASFAPARRAAAQAHLLRELVTGDLDCWLVNTGWSGGQAGRGSRIPLEATHALVTAALDGTLAAGEFRPDPHFGFEVPVAVEGVEASLLDPARAWGNQRDLTVAARRLVDMFAENFARFEEAVDPEVREAQPRMAIAAE